MCSSAEGGRAGHCIHTLSLIFIVLLLALHGLIWLGPTNSMTGSVENLLSKIMQLPA